jgi:hypothetical protein
LIIIKNGLIDKKGFKTPSHYYIRKTITLTKNISEKCGDDMASTVYSFAISGVEGYLVEVETDTIGCIPSVSIVGLGDTAVKEARERLEAALSNAGFYFPHQKVMINLAPSDMKKGGTHFDLAMAIGILARTKQIQPDNLKTVGFIGAFSKWKCSAVPLRIFWSGKMPLHRL